MQSVMRQTSILIATILIASVSFGQNVKRQHNETVESFIKRLMPETTELAHPIIEANPWDTSAKTIVAFYGYDDASDLNTGFNKIFGHLYLPTGQNNYRDITLGAIEEDSGYPEILSVFFSNA